jgi:hypothetical protein
LTSALVSEIGAARVPDRVGAGGRWTWAAERSPVADLLRPAIPRHRRCRASPPERGRGRREPCRSGRVPSSNRYRTAPSGSCSGSSASTITRIITMTRRIRTSV